MRPLRLLSITPFEAAVCMLLAISGVSQLGHWGQTDIVLSVLPNWEGLLFDVLSIFSGLFTITALAAAARRAEMAGLLMIIAIFLSRLLLFGAYLGYGSSFIQTGVFYAAVVWAAVVRFNMIRNGDTLFRIRGGYNDDDG